MKTVYAVFREAVYRHECVGIFSTLDQIGALSDTGGWNGGVVEALHVAGYRSNKSSRFTKYEAPPGITNIITKEILP